MDEKDVRSNREPFQNSVTAPVNLGFFVSECHRAPQRKIHTEPFRNEPLRYQYSWRASVAGFLCGKGLSLKVYAMKNLIKKVKGIPVVTTDVIEVLSLGCYSAIIFAQYQSVRFLSNYTNGELQT
ncbi:hypothetical protein C5467_11300 [Photorhabdus khanii subsp. guanajuatensis]|uniref:Uncharacterized protein n=1 Tax=Photorhabdus khanii subsp. guanajuatensis TaxID=2100166 RepID=A0A4R4JRN0_9GAMM|nr:hypothetical protein C5467_11300 [Photorhabdus khanii subsp. guanajuatensis]